MIKNLYILLFFALSILGCEEKTTKTSEFYSSSEAEIENRGIPLKDIIANLGDSRNKNIIVVSIEATGAIVTNQFAKNTVIRTIDSDFSIKKALGSNPVLKITHFIHHC